MEARFIITDELFIDVYRLPKPLSKEEVYDLFKRMNQGDSSISKILIEHNIRLVLYEVVNRFKSVDYDKKDLVSIGIFGLIKAVNTFDITKKIEFATYATKCIDNEILMFLRKIKNYQSTDSLDKVINCDNNGNELKVEDIVSDNVDFVEEYTNQELHEIIRELIRDLPPFDSEIIMLYFGFYDDRIYSQKEIGEKFNISQSMVSRIIKRILERLGVELKKKGVIELKSKNKTLKFY